MKHVLSWVALFAALTTSAFAEGPLEVKLELSPAATLPGLPGAVHIEIKNAGSSPVTVESSITATVTGTDGSTETATTSLPAAWTPELRRWSSYSIAPGATLHCVGPVAPFLAENELFASTALPLGKLGAWSVTVTVYTSGGTTGTSNPATVTINTPGGDDAAILEKLSEGGLIPVSSQMLVEGFDVIAQYPSSEYYRHVAPFVLYQRDRDDDRYATNLMLAVQGLPGDYVDGARAAIAQRYIDRAVGASARNRQAEAGEWSAKGRVYAQQLVESPSSAFGAILGNGLLPLLLTTEQWQAYYDSAHTGRTGCAPPPRSAA